jgi:D-alanyl-D-alanine dipeptidase
VLIDSKTQTELDIGVCFDFMNERSHITVGSEVIGDQAYQHRTILSQAMQKFDFAPYGYEFWHFTLNTRETEIPLDIAITPELVVQAKVIRY